jgi:multidrug efflux pump subunit AcrA (membrane-fusion protein)
MKINLLQKSRTIVLSTAVLISSLFYSCGNANDKTSEEQGGAPVKIVNPSLTNINDNLIFNANTIFQKKEIVRATFQGFIVKFFKRIGDRIIAGDEICEIQTKESSADGTMDINLGKESFKGLVSVKAKTSGVLTEQNHNTGDFVTDGEQIAVSSDPSSLLIELNVPYQFVHGIKLGSNCNIDVPDGKSLNGIIYKILPSVDQVSQTQTFLIQLKQFGNLPENLNVTVKIPTKIIRNALTIPKTSLMTDETQSKFWVMKLINDSTAVKVDVVKGIENYDAVQLIGGGLMADDRIISEGAFGLPDTAKVIIGK